MSGKTFTKGDRVNVYVRCGQWSSTFCTGVVDSMTPSETRRYIRPRRDAYPVLHVPSDGVGPNEAARRYADQRARKQAEELSTDGYTQARDLDLAAEREAIAGDLGNHGCDRSTALHFAAIVVAGLVARGKL